MYPPISHRSSLNVQYTGTKYFLSFRNLGVSEPAALFGSALPFFIAPVQQNIFHDESKRSGSECSPSTSFLCFIHRWGCWTFLVTSLSFSYASATRLDPPSTPYVTL